MVLFLSPSRSSASLLASTTSSLPRRRLNRLYSRVGLTIICLCIWLYVQSWSSSPSGELVTGRRTGGDRKRTSVGGLFPALGSHEEHLDSFLRRVNFKKDDDSSKQDVQLAPPAPPFRPPSAAAHAVQSSENQPKGVGAGGIPVWKTTVESQRMALFVVWPRGGADLEQSSFLLQSFLASPSSHVADLVLLLRGTDSECESHQRWISEQEKKIEEVGKHTHGAQTVCMTEEKYLKMHRDFLCERWSCSTEEKTRVLDYLLSASKDGDVFEDRFRLLRGLVFNQLVDKKIKWFGWAGHEVVLGSVLRQFPWDIAPNFDVVVPSVVAVSRDLPVALSPNLGFFQHRPSTEARLLDLPGLRSVDDFLQPPAKQTFTDLSFALLSSPQTTFLALEAHLSPINIPPTIARVITQSSVFTIFLPPVTNQNSKSSIPVLNHSHRKRFISLLNALRIPVHLRGTFSPSGVTTELAKGELGTFERLASADAIGGWKDKAVFYRLRSGESVHRRMESRSWSEEHEEMILEWGFDLASNHKTTPVHPPPYPPRRLEPSHALAFLPSRSSDKQPFGFTEEIWDPHAPAIREAAHDGEWWDGTQWQEKMRKMVRKDDAPSP